MNNLSCVCVDIFQQLQNILFSFSQSSVSTGHETFTHTGGFGTRLPELSAPGMGGGSGAGRFGETNMFTVFAIIAFIIFFLLNNTNQRRPTNEKEARLEANRHDFDEGYFD